jgi:ribonuclease P protein component
MFPKKKRVTKELFQAVMKKGDTLSSPLFVFRYMRQNQPQYAFIAPKSVAKQASDRNKLRRQGYSALRAFNIKSGIGLFFYKKQAKNATFSEIKADIQTILAKTRLL